MDHDTNTRTHQDRTQNEIALHGVHSQTKFCLETNATSTWTTSNDANKDRQTVTSDPQSPDIQYTGLGNAQNQRHRLRTRKHRQYSTVYSNTTTKPYEMMVPSTDDVLLSDMIGGSFRSHFYASRSHGSGRCMTGHPGMDKGKEELSRTPG